MDSTSVTATVPVIALPPVRPEVLAPAGNWDCARAAVENGADAIYFGLERFNARMRAGNFTEADLPQLMAFLHGRGVRGYLTFNTLVFADELAEAEDFLRCAISAGVDAAIVQDVGVCRLIRSISPDFPIHASTQMTITCDAGMEMARELGASMVVLARECSVAEIAKLRAASAAPVPLEVFVHGALCVAYSGQCLTSEALGGRSANRGECAQACRLPYELLADGQKVDLGDRRYLLSPQDLAGVELIPDLVRASVASLKIEGRLKTPEYVANITRVYRQAVDRVWGAISAGGDGAAAASEACKEFTYDMEMAFSRGLFTGWLGGDDNQRLVHARYPKKRGVFLGEVRELRPPQVGIVALGPVKQSDGVVFDLGQPDTHESGGIVTGVEARNGLTWLHFHHPSVNWQGIRRGAKVWKTSDPELDKRLRATFTGPNPNHRQPIRFAAHGVVGGALTLECRDALGNVAREVSALPLEPAHKQPLTAESLAKQLGRLGDTPFELGGVDASGLAEGLILPVSELNRLRRAVTARVLELRTQPKKWTIRTQRAESRTQVCQTETDRPVELVLLVRDLDQLDAALPLAHRDVYAEFEDPKKYREAMDRVRAFRERTGSTVALWVAPPRIHKMGEDWILRIVRSSEPDGYLCRNAQHLRAFHGSRLRGDFSLNVANPLAADWFMRRWGLEGVTASYDLNIAQLTALLEGAPPAWFEITLHQRMPMFHMAHCVYCAFLSQGKDYRDCGRPCEKHRVRLKDRTGAEHYLRADAGCRNTLFNSRTQTGADYADHLQRLGARRFRLEFLEEDADDVARTVDRYQRLLNGELTGEALWRELKLTNQLGVTRGTLR